jgi:hypothetical protein
MKLENFYIKPQPTNALLKALWYETRVWRSTPSLENGPYGRILEARKATDEAFRAWREEEQYLNLYGITHWNAASFIAVCTSDPSDKSSSPSAEVSESAGNNSSDQ